MEKTFIIAEAGVNHNGSLDRALKMIDAAKSAGADAIKFQTFLPDQLATEYAEKAEYQIESTLKDSNQLEMLKKISLSFDEFKILHKECNKKNIEFLSTAFDIKSLDFLKTLNLKYYKIPSGEITNFPLIKKIACLNKKVILSTGMSTIRDIEKVILLLNEEGLKNSKISILHCNSEYPTPLQNVNLLSMITLKNKFNLDIGLSDHSLGTDVPIAAVALGAKIIEKHFTLSRSLSGPDHKASLNPTELKNMVKSIRNIQVALGNKEKRPTKGELRNLIIARKSIVASKSIRKGEEFSNINLTTKRPGDGISPMKWNDILGQKSKFNFKKNDQIKL